MNNNRQSIRLMAGIGIPLVVLLTLVTLLASRANLTHAASGPGNRSNLKNFQHVFVIMMENTCDTANVIPMSDLVGPQG